MCIDLSDRMIRFDPTVDKRSVSLQLFSSALPQSPACKSERDVVKPTTSIPLKPAPSRSRLSVIRPRSHPSNLLNHCLVVTISNRVRRKEKLLFVLVNSSFHKLYQFL
ncbi:hypothetical protein PSHT_09177 [Puccinia striiformis]|uniref:Uncharacterized protein n=1 Tax=Puccinia striiformis TaxID=27350 RepID=A0A2S4VIA4_9BASI|nr:hypothetical protein PSHT_09177 [Puccinia striiformis]